MKIILSLIFAINVLGLTIFAQRQPPAPLIYSAPEKLALKEFVSPDKSFQITFAGTPEINEKKTETQNFTSYRVNRAGSNSIISITEFASVVEGKKDKIYESVKNNYLKDSKTKLESEKDITIDGITWKEFSFLQDYNYIRLRLNVNGKRVYGIESDVTNWHILTKYNLEKVKDFNNETDRFFNSFKLLKNTQ